MLITNSDWDYTRRLMAIAFDPYLPRKTTWRDLFDLVIVGAGKPGFFAEQRPLYRVIDEEQGLLLPQRGDLEPGGVYFGGCAAQVEEHLGLSGDEILYVGDHLYADVHVSKAVLRWRTALILRELEAELTALDSFREQQRQLETLMEEKVRLEFALSQARLALQRHQHGDPAWVDERTRSLREAITALRARIVDLDDRVAPLARESGELGNRRWGPLMRAGNDKSHLAQQVERFADIYTSRVSNFLYETPYGYLRAPRGTLPHDDAPLVE